MLRRLRRWWYGPTTAEQQPEARFVVTTDDLGISVAHPDRPTQFVAWASLSRVIIETNDTGPFGSDFWWILTDDEETCSYPQGATGEDEALDAFKERLPGFDWEALIRASSSVENAFFECWRKDHAD